MNTAAFFVILATLVCLSTAGFHAATETEGPAICGHDAVWNYRQGLLNRTKTPMAACATETSCDNPAIRDATDISDIKTIKIRFHIMMSSSGAWPSGLTQAKLDAGIALFKKDFAKLRIDFQVTGIDKHPTSYYYCLPAYSSTNPAWIIKAEEMKQDYAVNPGQEMNVFVACMNSGSAGTLLGFGSFPWDDASLGVQGGVFMNSVAISGTARTLTHEFGHNLGLWHTFHGQSEVSCGSGCYEPPHVKGDPAADRNGDFCSDTLAAPIYWDCSNPTGRSCDGSAWINSPEIYSNFMSYSTDECMTTFTEQQIKRSHCYICSKLRGLAAGCKD